MQHVVGLDNTLCAYTTRVVYLPLLGRCVSGRAYRDVQEDILLDILSPHERINAYIMYVFMGANVVVKYSFRGYLPTTAQTAQKGVLWDGPCFQGNHAGIRS